MASERELKLIQEQERIRKLRDEERINAEEKRAKAILLEQQQKGLQKYEDALSSKINRRRLQKEGKLKEYGEKATQSKSLRQEIEKLRKESKSFSKSRKDYSRQIQRLGARRTLTPKKKEPSLIEKKKALQKQEKKTTKEQIKKATFKELISKGKKVTISQLKKAGLSNKQINEIGSYERVQQVKKSIDKNIELIKKAEAKAKKRIKTLKELAKENTTPAQRKKIKTLLNRANKQQQENFDFLKNQVNKSNPKGSVVKGLESYQKLLKGKPSNFTKATGLSKKYLDKLEQDANKQQNITQVLAGGYLVSNIGKDSVTQGFKRGSAQIIRDPFKYKADEDVQDAIDLLTKPKQTIIDTKDFIVSSPKTYVGEIGAEIAFIGGAEVAVRKGYTTFKNKGSKFLKGAKGEFKKRFGKKKLVKKVGGKFIPVYGQVTTANDVYRVLRAGYIATIPIKKGESKSAYDIRIDKKVLKDLGKDIKQTKQKGKVDIKKAKADIKKAKEKLKIIKSKKKSTKKSIKATKKILSKQKKPSKKKQRKLVKKKEKLKTIKKTKKKAKKVVKQKKKGKQKKKQILKQKLKQKKKAKKKVKKVIKGKKKAKKKLKQKKEVKEKKKIKGKGGTKKKSGSSKKKITLKLDKGKPKKQKSFKQAKTKAEKHLLLTKGKQTATIKTKKTIKKITKKKKGIKYVVGKKKKTLKLSETSKKSKGKKKKSLTLKTKSIKKKKKGTKKATRKKTYVSKVKKGKKSSKKANKKKSFKKTKKTKKSTKKRKGKTIKRNKKRK